KPVADEVDLPAEVPQPLAPITIVGTRNGSFSGKIVLTSREAMKNVRAEMTDLTRTGGQGRIPAAAARVRYGLHLPGVMCFDPLGETPPADSPVLGFSNRVWKSKSRAVGHALQPIWVIVDVPPDAAPGDYEGKLTVTVGDAAPFAVPVRLEVCDWRLPDPQQFQTFVELVQSPETVAMEYDVPLWSDRHFTLMAKSLELLGRIGSRTAYVHLVAETNHGNAETMVRWIRQKGGSFRYDFTPMDRYLDLVERYRKKPFIVCLYVWDNHCNERLEPEGHRGCIPASTGEVPVTCLNDDGTVTTIKLPKYGSPESKALWKPLMDEIRLRLKKRGWEGSMVLGLATDNAPTVEVVNFFKEICPGLRWMRQGHDSTYGELANKHYYYQASVLISQFAYQRKGERWHGWLPTPQGRHERSGSIVAHFPRQMRNHCSRCKFRMLGELNIAGNQRGFGRIGADIWPVLRNSRGNKVGILPQRYPHTSWRNLAIHLAMLYPGPEGASPTARYQVMLEGVQECEARIFIEKAITEKKIDGELAKRCEEILDERVKALTEQMGDKWGYGDWRWESERLEYPAFIASDWQARSKKLYDAAAEVAAALQGR
ncbi:MAG TPA: glycoside hydrolase domain-containing protein, partial [Planctomycetota bacterium]|nr:glycoside hydrolase domain-containing protein [Planctomycetota bacterium]